MSSKEILPSEFIIGIKSGKYGKNAIIKYCETLYDLEEFSIDLIVEQSKLFGKYNEPIIAIKGNSVSLNESMPKSAKMEYERLSVAIHTIETMMKKSQHYPNDKQPTEATPPTDQLGIMTDRAKKYFEKAIEAGYMEKAGSGYKWIFPISRGSKAALSFFIMMVYNPDNCKQIPFKALERLFNVGRLDSAYSAMLTVKKPQEWRGMIETLFND